MLWGSVGIAAFFAVGLVVSLRLLGLWRRTRQLPELVCALGLLGIGPLGFCVASSGVALFGQTPLGHLVLYCGLGVQVLGFVASAIFTWRVFHPSSGWARGLAAGLSLGLIVMWVFGATDPTPDGHLFFHHHVSLWLKILVLAWASAESLRYWRVARRRVAMGFADPLVSASFLMWGVALGAGVIGFAIVYAVLACEPQQALSDLVRVLLSLCGIVSAASLYLALLPPQAYARWLYAHAGSAEAGS